MAEPEDNCYYWFRHHDVADMDNHLTTFIAFYDDREWWVPGVGHPVELNLNYLICKAQPPRQ